MLSSRTAIHASTLSTTKSSSIRSLSLLSNNNNSLLNNGALTNNNNTTTQQQSRSLVGLVHAIDKRVYRWAKGVLPPISKTENIALGCGTIGKLFSFVCFFVILVISLLLLLAYCKSNISSTIIHPSILFKHRI